MSIRSLVGAVAVQKHDKLPRRAGVRIEPRTIKFSGHFFLV